MRLWTASGDSCVKNGGNDMRMMAFVLLLLGSSTGLAQSLLGLCMLSDAHGDHRGDRAQLMLARIDCDEKSDGCSDMNNSSTEWSRWTGVSAEMLQSEGTTLTGRMSADPGDLTCSGNVHDGVLSGRYH